MTVDFLPFAKRDIRLAGISAGLWLLDAAIRRRNARGLGATLIGVTTGLSTGVIGFLAHEWGHLFGAVASGGVAHPNRREGSPYLFRFDVNENTRSQFIAMSIGGIVSTTLTTAAILKLVPRKALSGRVVLVATAAGLAATAVAELPVLFRVLNGAPLPGSSH